MRNRKDNRKTMVILFSALIVLSMVVSIFAIVVDNQNQSSLTYNKHSFTVMDNSYRTKINGKYMDFYSYPTELERIPLDRSMIDKLRNAQGVVFIFDPNDTNDDLVYIDSIRYDLQSQLNISVYFGITQDSAKYTLPIATCDNATSYLPFIFINISSNTSFTTSYNADCIVMNARLKEILSAKDRLVYSYYGIMT